MEEFEGSEEESQGRKKGGNVAIDLTGEGRQEKAGEGKRELGEGRLLDGYWMAESEQ